MSLDVYLRGPAQTVPCTCTTCWNEHTREDRDCFFDANITHNLTAMAREAGIYEACWEPEEIGITKAVQLIEPLRKGLKLLKAEPYRFQTFNPKNGWGDYDGFVRWIQKYLEACEQYPDADVSVSR